MAVVRREWWRTRRLPGGIPSGRTYAVASHYRDGEVTDVELIAKYTSDTLAYVVEVERGRSKVGGADEVVPLAVRTTSVFRLESGSWKLVHRHADPITTPRPA